MLSRPFELEGHSLTVGISIGIAEFPQHGEDMALLMRRADVAMYHAKKNKLEKVVYNPMQDEHSKERLSMLNDLNHANWAVIAFRAILSVTLCLS